MLNCVMWGFFYCLNNGMIKMLYNLNGGDKGYGKK